MKKLLISAVSATLLFSACGGSSGDSAQDGVADLLIGVAEDQDLQLDEDCVRSTSAKFSDADAQALVDAGIDGDPEISDAGDVLGEQIFNECVDASSYLDSLITSFSEDGTVDADCLQDALKGLTVGEIDEEIFDVAFDCAKD